MRRFLARFGIGDPSGDSPWLRSPSIAQHIRSHLDPESGRLRHEGQTLPDEAVVVGEGGLRWAAGARDGALGHHFGGGANRDQAARIADHLQAIAQRDSARAKQQLYDLLRDDSLLDVIDPVMEAVVERQLPAEPHLHAFAALLARSAPDRGPVKFAIALLGLLGRPEDVELVSLLGRHDEFTLYAGVALSHMLDEPERELWRLAQLVDGWGRVQLVERLAGTHDPEIRAWMLREGFRNSVMYEYLAYTCATTGGLSEALVAETVDDGLLVAAGEIITALLNGGPAEDIGDYAEAAPALERYLRHLAAAPRALPHLLVAAAIGRYLERDDWDDGERAGQGWTPRLRDQLRDAARRYVAEPGWQTLVEAELSAEDELRFDTAARAAAALGLDLWPVYWQRLQAAPRDTNRWFAVMQHTTDVTIGQAVALALRELPLDLLGSGPGEALGIEPAYAQHFVFDAIVPHLGEHPGLGWPIVAAALRSPVIRHRNQALLVLSRWGRERWPAEPTTALQAALGAEPSADVRARIERVLRGEQADPESAGGEL